MASDLNEHGQLLGAPVSDWYGAAPPVREVVAGRYCRLEPLSVARHGAALFAALSLDTSGKGWTYLPYGPFADFESYAEWLRHGESVLDPLFFTVIETAHNKPVGVAAYLRIDAAAGSIEVGHLHFSPLLQQTRAATEAMYLMMERAFALGYRRYEWKCDALNVASRRAAQRLGLSFEGIFRQARVIKGRNRDTAWFAAIDREWPALEKAFQTWLSPDNFDADGLQKVALSTLTNSLQV